MRLVDLVVVGVIAVACGHARIPDKVFEADVAKLDPAAVAQLDAARAEIGQAQGEISIASQQVGEARAQHSLGEADQKTAEAEEERVKKLVEAAEVRRRAADAHHDYAEKLIESREAAEEAGRCRVELAEAKLELARFESLAQANPAAAAPYKKADFLDRVAKTQRDLDDTRQKVAKLDQEAKRDEQKWKDLAAKVPKTE